MSIPLTSLRWGQSYRGSGLVRPPGSTRNAQTWPRRWLASTSTTAVPSSSQSPASDTTNATRQPFVARVRTRKSAMPKKHQLKPRKQEAKTRLKSSNTPQRVLIKQPVDYAAPYARKQSYRKHDKSLGQQAWQAAVRETGPKSTTPMPTWQETLDFMRRHTPKYGESLDLKVHVGRDSADHARQTFSELDTNLWQIQRRHQCRVAVDSGRFADEPLVFSLSGPTASVRNALLEVVGAVGRVSAIRNHEESLKLSLDDLPKALREGPNPVTIHDIRDNGRVPELSKDQVLNIFNYNRFMTTMTETPPAKRLYNLMVRADDIPLPAEWSQLEFVRYIVKLTCGKVPRHLYASLYPAGPDHDETVAQLLVKLFGTDDLRPHMTTTALKAAIGFLSGQGPRFRPEIRAIWGQAIKLHLEIDAPCFNYFLRAASKAGDLEGFNDVLREIVRRGHYMQSDTWRAFLLMVQDPVAKFHIITRWKSMGLSHLQEGYVDMVRQIVLLECQALPESGISAKQFIEKQHRAYGSKWLDVMTANHIIYTLGSQGNGEGCFQVLDALEGGVMRNAAPNNHTLGAMLTHQRTILGKVAVLERLSTLTPDRVDYHVLFQAAYKRGLPNVVKVVWRYAAFSGSTTPGMLHSLAKVMRDDAGGTRSTLQAFQDTIFGRDELAAARLTPDAGPTWLINKYFLDAGAKRPSVPLATKLREAYEMDMKIKALVKEGREVTPEMREELTVEIPMEIPIGSSQTEDDISGFVGIRKCRVHDYSRVN
ncbi:hypothetical protein GGR57DRAFT_157206 [Xylariaceae sp. FL1272]|nr:hypothetical protein GGR57DRAFT_157206 [Xylariaceae sp. FL1272]